MIKLNDKSDCCGCSACYSICSHHAIEFTADQEGFFYPVFNQKLCIDCGLCEKVCPVIHYKTEPKTGNPVIYSAINKNVKQYMQSSSGGIFILLCEYIISNGGIVCGAVYDKNFVVKHSFARTLDECRAFQGSKYVQSDIRGIYPKIKSILKSNIPVLFSGTPCQVAGLKLYLRKDYNNLYTVDLICHGVPSPLIFKDYLNFVKGKNEISHINMKSKSEKKGTAIRFDFLNGKYVRQTLKTDLWNKLYFGSFIVRPSCHSCQFTNYNRVGDITIGDSWGINKYYPNFHADEMTSLLFVNTSKGLFLHDKISHKIDKIEITKEESLQPQLQYPTKESFEREHFWENYLNNGFNHVIKKYLGFNRYEIAKSQLKLFLHKLFLNHK